MDSPPVRSEFTPPPAVRTAAPRPPATETNMFDRINVKTAAVALAIIVACVWLAPTATAAVVYSVLAVATLAIALLVIKCIVDSDSSSSTIHHSSERRKVSYIHSDYASPFHHVPIVRTPPANYVAAGVYGSGYTGRQQTAYPAFNSTPAFRAPVDSSQSSDHYAGAPTLNNPQRAIVGDTPKHCSYWRSNSNLPGQAFRKV